MSKPSLVILGNGKLFLQPDVAFISLPIVAIEVEYSKSIESLNLKSNSLLAIIERNGISKDSLTTSDVDISENWKYYTDKIRKPKLTGFTARQDKT